MSCMPREDALYAARVCPETTSGNAFFHNGLNGRQVLDTASGKAGRVAILLAPFEQ